MTVRRRAKEPCRSGTETGPRDGGSALVALLAVLVILGLIAVISLSMNGDDAKPVPATATDVVRVACQADLDAIRASAEAVNVHEGMYPTDAVDLIATAGKGGVLLSFPASTNYAFAYPGRGGPPHVDVSGPGVESLTDSCRLKS